MIPIKDQIIIITGAASGFGKELAKRCVENGAFVVLGDIKMDQLRALAEELNRKLRINPLKPNAIFASCDVTKKSEFKNLFQIAKDSYGHFTSLVNNAGIAENESFLSDCDHSWNEAHHEDSWKRVVDIDLTAVILGTQLAISEIQTFKLEQDYSIINVASLAGIYPQPFQPVYAAAKAGVVNFTKSLKYLESDRIRINAICPSYVKTPLTVGLQTSGGVEKWVDIKLVIDAFMMAIQDEALAGEIIRITPEFGIDIYRSGKRTSSKL